MAGPGPSSAYYANLTDPSNSAHHSNDRQSPPSSPLLSPRESDDDTLHAHQAESLYAILNVDRSSSESEIRDRYRSLATTFHPDRQRDAATKAAAHARFQDIQRAYEILMDPERRTIYDILGEEGLQTRWELGPRNRTPEELRRYFQQQHYEQLQQDVNELVRAKGKATINLDARAIFIPKSLFLNPERYKHDVISRIRRLQKGQIALEHSFETPIGDNGKTRIEWKALMASGKAGNILGTVRHQFSPKFSGSLSTGIFAPRATVGKASYMANEHTSVTVTAIQQTWAAPPRLSFTVNRLLYPSTTGYLSYNTGFFSLGPWGKYLSPNLAASSGSSLTLGLNKTKNDGTGWTTETSAGLTSAHLNSSWSIRVLGLKIKIGGEVNDTTGLQGFVEGEGRVTKYIRAAMNVSLQYRGGVIMNLRFSRLGQRVSVPILLTHDLNPYVVFGATMIPAVSYVSLYHYYILPRKKRRLEDRVKELRETHADYIAQKKSEAEQAISIMERPTAIKTAAEREKHGLIIVSAQYGPASAFTSRGIRSHDTETEVIDVTIPVQALVSSGKLVIPGGRGKFNILGFWDPCMGEKKKLRIRYLFREKLHEVTLDDLAAVRLPVKAHALDE